MWSNFQVCAVVTFVHFLFNPLSVVLWSSLSIYGEWVLWELCWFGSKPVMSPKLCMFLLLVWCMAVLKNLSYLCNFQFAVLMHSMHLRINFSWDQKRMEWTARLWRHFPFLTSRKICSLPKMMHSKSHAMLNCCCLCAWYFLSLRAYIFSAWFTCLSLFCRCSVCLLDYEGNDLLRKLPRCSHLFHVQCIDQWLESHCTCPLCRTALNELQSSQNNAQSSQQGQADAGPSSATTNVEYRIPIAPSTS